MNAGDRVPDSAAAAALPNIGDFGMDTISLAGTLPAKLAAVRDAGFSQIMLSARDVVGHPEGFDAAAQAVRSAALAKKLPSRIERSMTSSACGAA
jgi:hypothetical protein